MTTPSPELRPRKGGVSARELIATLASTDYRARYANSRLGFLWAVVKPLLLFGVLYFVFAHALKFGAGIENYPLMLLLGVIMWTLFSELTSSAVTVFVSHADLLRKVSLRPVYLVISTSLTSIYVFASNILIALAFAVATGAGPHLSWLWIPLLLAELIALGFGMALILAVLYPRLRDLGQLWEVLLQVLFYATPVIWPITLVDENLREWLLLSPLAQIFQQTREVTFGSGAGVYSEAVSGPIRIVPYALVAAVIISGLTLYQRRWRTIVEQL